MKKSVKWLSVLIIGGLLLSFAACQKNTPATPSSSGVSSAGGTTAVRDSINVGIVADPGDLSPWAGANSGRADTEELLYQSLATNISGELESLLYREYKLSDDEKYLDVFLYDYIHDSAGNPLKASDVVFCFNTAMSLGSTNAISMCDRVEAIEEYTVRFYFNKILYMGELARLLSQFFIVTKAAYEASPDGMATNPVGTGPYNVVKYTSGYLLSFERISDYWQTDDSLTPARAKANIKTINFYIITETSQITMALENGSIDMSWHVGNDDMYLFNEGGPQSGKYQIYKTPDNLVVTMSLNNDAGAITSTSVDLRRAIYYAVNSEVILQSVYNGSGTVTYDIARPGNLGYSKSWETEDNYYHYNLDRAKEYLAKAGFKPGQLTLNLLCDASGTYSNIAVLVQAFLSQIGIDVKINAVQSALLQSYMIDPAKWDIVVMAGGSATYVVDIYGTSMVASRNPWNGTANFVKDDKLQQLLEAAMLQKSFSDATVDALHQYVVENAYGRGIVNFYNSYVIPKDLSTVELSYKKAILPGACTYTN